MFFALARLPEKREREREWGKERKEEEEGEEGEVEDGWLDWIVGSHSISLDKYKAFKSAPLSAFFPTTLYDTDNDQLHNILRY